jgi:hypothetical protein
MVNRKAITAMITLDVLKTTEHADLYHLYCALDEMHYHRQEAAETGNIVLWSPEEASQIFDSFDKVQAFDVYAWELGVKITLSAAQDSQLRDWGRTLGWKVLWDNLAMDNLLKI